MSDNKQQNGHSSNDNESRLKELKLGSNVSTKELAVYSESDIKKHTKESDCWMIIHGLVYDVTKFLEDHPGTYRAVCSVFRCGSRACHVITF